MVVLVIRRVQVTMVQNVFFISDRRIKSLVLMIFKVYVIIKRIRLIDCNVFMMHFTLSVSVMITTVLVVPEEIIIGRHELKRSSVERATLQTMVLVTYLFVRRDISILEAGSIASMDTFVRCYIIIANFKSTTGSSVRIFICFICIDDFIFMSKHRSIVAIIVAIEVLIVVWRLDNWFFLLLFICSWCSWFGRLMRRRCVMDHLSMAVFVMRCIVVASVSFMVVIEVSLWLRFRVLVVIIHLRSRRPWLIICIVRWPEGRRTVEVICVFWLTMDLLWVIVLMSIVLAMVLIEDLHLLCRLGLHRDDLCRLVVLSPMKFLYVIRLHLKD